MTRTVNIITAVYTRDPTEYGYEKGKTYGLKLTQDDQFPIVLVGSRRCCDATRPWPLPDGSGAQPIIARAPLLRCRRIRDRRIRRLVWKKQEQQAPRLLVRRGGPSRFAGKQFERH
jgi:hypothetical protein